MRQSEAGADPAPRAPAAARSCLEFIAHRPAAAVPARPGDKDFATICRQVLAGIEQVKSESVPEAAPTKRATVRKQIKEFVAERARGKGD